MIEKPILFSPAMVRVLPPRGPKSQTRRTRGLGEINESPDDWTCDEVTPEWATMYNGTTGEIRTIKCPYGPAGTRLWVKEGWLPVVGSSIVSVQYLATGTYLDLPLPSDWTPPQAAKRGKTVTSLFMPRWASRSTFLNTGWRIERVQEITEADAVAEGITTEDLIQWLRPTLDRSPAVPMHWIHGADEGFSWCAECAEKEIKKLRRKNPSKEYILDGGWSIEEDSQQFCEGCRRELDCSYTDYAIESELDHFNECGVVGAADEHSLYTILSCGFKKEETGRVLRAGYSWLWDHLNGKKLPFSRNGWVWVINFEPQRTVTP